MRVYHLVTLTLNPPISPYTWIGYSTVMFEISLSQSALHSERGKMGWQLPHNWQKGHSSWPLGFIFFNQQEKQLTWEEMILQSEKRGVNGKYKKDVSEIFTLLSPFKLSWPGEVHFPHISLVSPSQILPAERGDGHIGMECWGLFNSSFSIMTQSWRGPKKRSIV